jgi:hypothetical protein
MVRLASVPDRAAIAGLILAPPGEREGAIQERPPTSGGQQVGALADALLAPLAAVRVASDELNRGRQEAFERCMGGRGYARVEPGSHPASGVRRPARIGVLHHGPDGSPGPETIRRALAGPGRLLLLRASEDAGALEALGAGLRRHAPDVLVASGGPAVLALRPHTATTPIVMVAPDLDPRSAALAGDGPAPGKLTGGTSWPGAGPRRSPSRPPPPGRSRSTCAPPAPSAWPCRPSC